MLAIAQGATVPIEGDPFADVIDAEIIDDNRKDLT